MAGEAIVITGASSGIGAALARALSRSGRTLHLIARNRDRLLAVAAGCRNAGAACEVHAVDITDRARFAETIAAIEASGPIALFVSNAGILDGRRADQAVEDGATARRVLDINLNAAVDAVHAVLPGMRARRQGRIVLVASLAAFVPLTDAPAYSASKAGLLAYGQALNEALRDEGVSVAVICPGYVDTAFEALHIGERPMAVSAEDAARRIVRLIDSGRPLGGFPFPLYWLSRISALMPAPIRRLGTRGLRFHVGEPPKT
jgi:short-subunit dehydrogenase